MDDKKLSRPGLRGREITFTTIDESSRLKLNDTTVGKPGPYVSAFEIECSWCGAERYECCRNSPDEQRFDGIKHVHGLHGARIKDADLATATMRALVE